MGLSMGQKRIRSSASWWTRVGLVVAVAAAASVAPAVVGTSTVDAQGWQGFAVSQLPSGVSGGDSPSWGLGVTEDLGGPGVDIWNNNHGNMSEAIIDVGSASPQTQTAASYGSGITNGPDTHGVAFSDIDGDGDEDLLEVSGRNNPSRLFRNDSGVLVDVDPGELTDLFGRGRQPIFLDFDNDGDMDVLITNLDLRSDPVPQNERQLKPSEVYLNNGNGTVWTKLADPNEILSDGHVRIASLTSTGPATPSIVVTHDVFNLAKDSIAVGSGSFAEPANPAVPRSLPAKPIREVIVGDFDGDLHPEFIAFIGNESASGGNWQMQAFEVSNAGNGGTVNLPGGALVDNCRSGTAADFDNDGDLDILAGCAQLQEGQNRNVLLLNDGQGNFSDGGTSVLPATIAETPGAIVTADVNADGWMDAIVANGYDFDPAVDHVLTNQKGTTGHWLRIDLVGSNPDASGAQVFVGSNTWQVRESGHRYHRSQDERTLHFGLGAQTKVAPVQVRWADGTYQSCTVSGTDRRVTITKGSASCTNQTRDQVLATIATAPVTGPTTPPPPAEKTCGGLTVTVDFSKGERPTEGDDVIIGTPTANAINALGGNDVICGLGGDDVINGGPGFDKVFGGQGADTLTGGDGNDLLIGGGGNDRVEGGKGNDRIQGGDGADTLLGGNGLDRISGGNGNDVLKGGKFADQLFGNLGRDTLEGGDGNDVLKGGAWVDTFHGGNGSDGCTMTDPSGATETRISCESGVFGR